MLANTLNICSDEELEHDGAHVEDGKIIKNFDHFVISFFLL